MLRIKQSINDLFPLFASTGEAILRILWAEQTRRRDFKDQATPGFELGKKDLQSPALPLGHVAKILENRWKFSRITEFYSYCTCILIPVFRNPCLQRRTPFDCIWSTPSSDFLKIHNAKKILVLVYWETKYVFSAD